MSLKTNIFASYASQIYAALIGIIMVPMYIKYMGAEAYGLVGFFAMLQAWFNLLDMGLTPTIARETARFHGGSADALSYCRLVRALEGIFLVVALLGGAVMFAASGYIAHEWLQASQIALDEVQTAVQFMAAIIAMRWMCGLYRGAISGAEQLVWLSSFNSTIATLRFIGVLPILIFVGVTPTIFFAFQFVVALVELTGLKLYALRILPSTLGQQQLLWDWRPLKPVLKFSLTIAFTSSVWVFVTQTDKLVLSRILPLAEYGHFTLAVLVASGVMIVSGPVSGAIMPRMSKLEAKGDHAGLIRVYRQATQLIAIIAGAASVTVAFRAESLLWVWTGDNFLAHQVAPILILYAIGNGIMGVSAFPYYLQYAKGDMRLHLIGNGIFIVLLVPAIIWAARHYGAVGAGYAWLGLNLLYFTVWMPFVHMRFEPGLNMKWYVQDVLVIVAPATIAAYGLNHVLPYNDSRWMQLAEIIAIGLFAILIGAVASSEVRARVSRWFMLRQQKKRP